MTEQARTKWFLDTEFYEDGRTIELISLAIVSEDGRELYWETPGSEALASSSDWLKENVLPYLIGQSFSRAQIARELRESVLANGERPEFWAYFGDYDWVALCQLFGRMIDLPKGFPMYCRDLKQLMDERGISKKDLPAQKGIAHNALEDARWIRDAYLNVQRTQRPLVVADVLEFMDDLRASFADEKREHATDPTWGDGVSHAAEELRWFLTGE